MAPAAEISLATTGFLSRVWPIWIWPSRRCRSAKSLARQKIAMTSEATVMSKPASRGKPLATPPSEVTMERKARSFMSMPRRHVTRRWSMSSLLPQ